MLFELHGVYIFRLDESKVVKIADFGLARDIDEKDYYRVEDRGRPLPIKWMAPECLDTFKFDSRSDIVSSKYVNSIAVYQFNAVIYYVIIFAQWSFGVTLWEVMTRGRKPYAGVDNLDMKRYLQRGGRLEKPPFCPDLM